MQGLHTAQGTAWWPACPPLLERWVYLLLLWSLQSPPLLQDPYVWEKFPRLLWVKGVQEKAPSLEVQTNPPAWPGVLGGGLASPFPCLPWFNLAASQPVKWALGQFPLQTGSPPGVSVPVRQAAPLESGTYEMASIMSMPISTQQWAWSALASGSPETQ